MSFKTLLTHVEPTADSDARLHAAVQFAKACDASLLAVAGAAPMIADNPLLAAFGGGLAVETCAEEEARGLESCAARFQTIAGPLGPRAIWRTAALYPNACLRSLAAAADLILAGMEHSRNLSANVVDVILESGLPVIAMPPGRGALTARRVLIAWKDSREARRAVSEALPLLRTADEVTLLSVSGRSEVAESKAAIAGLEARLQRHGIQPLIESVATRHDVGDEIIAFALARKIDLLVCGAYGHSRANEWLLGGVTDSLLRGSPLPVLFSH